MDILKFVKKHDKFSFDFDAIPSNESFTMSNVLNTLISDVLPL